VSGTQRPYAYVRTYVDRGAPWTFIVQNQTPHCGIINRKGTGVGMARRRCHTASATGHWMVGFITTAPSATENGPDPRPALVPPSCHSTVDTWGNANWMISSATVDRGQRPPRTMVSAAATTATRRRAATSPAAHEAAVRPSWRRKRYPGDFDGIVAGAPAYNWTALAAQAVRNGQATYPDPQALTPLFTPEELKGVESQILEACDTLDGVKDGVMEDPRRCSFNVDALSLSAT